MEKTKNVGKHIRNILFYAGLIVWALISLFPFYWLTVMSTRTSSEFFRYPPVMVPGSSFLTNLEALLTIIDFPGAVLNSLIVSGAKTGVALFLCSMTAFYFAKFEFPGRKFLYAFLLMTMMIPQQLLMIPQLIMMGKLGWISTLKALIIPNMIPAFGIFWMTQYCRGAIHDDLLNAGRIDGCGTFRLFWNIGFPIMIPGLSFLAIHTFVSSWNDFLWPLIVLNDQKVYTMQVALGQLQGMFTKTDYGAVMCGTLLATLPVVIIFLICNKFFIAGIAASGVKD